MMAAGGWKGGVTMTGADVAGVAGGVSKAASSDAIGAVAEVNVDGCGFAAVDTLVGAAAAACTTAVGGVAASAFTVLVALAWLFAFCLLLTYSEGTAVTLKYADEQAIHPTFFFGRVASMMAISDSGSYGVNLL